MSNNYANMHNNLGQTWIMQACPSMILHCQACNSETTFEFTVGIGSTIMEIRSITNLT